MAFRIEFATDAEHDLELIFDLLDHLVESHLSFGDNIPEALSRATALEPIPLTRRS